MTANASVPAIPNWDSLRTWFHTGDCTAIRNAVSAHIAQLATESEQRNFFFEYTVFMTNEAIRMGLVVEQLECSISLITQLALVQSHPLADCARKVLDLAEVLYRQLHSEEKVDSNYLISRAKVFIRGNLHNKLLDLEQVSKHIGLSKNYFCMLFHQVTGVRFGKYLKQERLNHAKQLLRSTHLRVFEISEECGFSSAKYFSYTFKQAFGCTPLEYQKRDHRKMEEK